MCIMFVKCLLEEMFDRLAETEPFDWIRLAETESVAPEKEF